MSKHPDEPQQPEDPASVGEPGAHPPLSELPDNDPASVPTQAPPLAPRDSPTPDLPAA